MRHAGVGNIEPAFVRRKGKAVRLDAGSAIGRVDVVFHPTKNMAFATWLETGRQGAKLMMRAFHPDGALGAAHVLLQTDAARASGFPRIIATEKDFILAWTDAADGPRVKTARIPLP